MADKVNKNTIEAIQEYENDKTETFNSVAEMFKVLDQEQ